MIPEYLRPRSVFRKSNLTPAQKAKRRSDNVLAIVIVLVVLFVAYVWFLMPAHVLIVQR